jgi:hypothetical protein
MLQRHAQPIADIGGFRQVAVIGAQARHKQLKLKKKPLNVRFGS